MSDNGNKSQRPIEKRGGYQPSATGPPPTKPPTETPPKTQPLPQQPKK
jgi:hypothetical protein